MCPLFTFPKNVLGVCLGAMAGVVRAGVMVNVLGVFKSVWWSDTANEYRLHPTQFSGDELGWFEGIPVYKPLILAFLCGWPQSPVFGELGGLGISKCGLQVSIRRDALHVHPAFFGSGACLVRDVDSLLQRC